MKSKSFILFLGIFFYSIINAQKVVSQTTNSDSIKNEQRIERIQQNVQKYFVQQNKRFKDKLKGFDKEYLVYCTPTYQSDGCLGIFSTSNIFKPTRFQIQDSLPVGVSDYATFLLDRSNTQWCKERFGYEKLEWEDDFAILFIFSPKNIPDSISILKIKSFSTDELLTASPERKRMINLAYSQIHFNVLAAGLNERFVTVVLKY